MRILFQGDSITDGHRSRDDHPSHCLGHGYVYLVAASLTSSRPLDGWRILNRGVSGDKIEDLTRRWQPDTLALQPSLLSILVGVNDVWHRLDAGQAFSIDGFARHYRQLLVQTTETLPATRLILCEPFFLPGPATAAALPLWQGHLADQQACVASLAAEFQATLVRFQPLFDSAAHLAPPSHWLWDGVHPTPAGHRLMADHWLASTGLTTMTS